MSGQSSRSAGGNDVSASPWFQKAAQVLVEDGLGEEFIGDVLHAHHQLTDRSLRALVSALRVLFRGSVVSHDLAILIPMARRFAQRGGFGEGIRRAPSSMARLATCWLELHPEDVRSAMAAIPCLHDLHQGARERLLHVDARGELQDACARVSTSPRRVMIAVGAVCMQNASGTASTGVELTTQHKGEVREAPNALWGDSMASSKIILSSDEDVAHDHVEQATKGEHAVKAFQDEILQDIWNSLAAAPCDSGLWDEAAQFLKAVGVLITKRLSERDAMRDTLNSVVTDLNHQHAATLAFLHLHRLPYPVALQPLDTSEALEAVRSLAILLDEHANLRARIAHCADVEEEQQILSALRAMRDRILAIHAELLTLLNGMVAQDAAVEEGQPMAPARHAADGGASSVVHASIAPGRVQEHGSASVRVEFQSSGSIARTTDGLSPVPAGNSIDALPPSAKPALPDVAIELVLNEQRALAKNAGPSITMCLDFGTARSKAFATRSIGGVTEPIPLAIGEIAGTGEPSNFSLGSSVWIDEEHQRIYFGQKAVVRSYLARRPGHQRIDSFKDLLSQAELVGNELRDPVAKLISDHYSGSNPTDIPFSQGDVLLLFLGFLTWTAEEALRRGGMGSGHVRRRFALPSWSDAKRAAGTRLLKHYMARAQLIADSVEGQWAKGLPLKQAKELTDSVFQVKENRLPLVLLGEGIPEPIAAAATRVEIKERQRRLVMVVDVGAGTTDYATFFINEDPKEGIFRMTPVAFHTWSGAGNRLDEILREMVLARIGQNHLRALYSEQIELRQREYKETLFDKKEVSIVLGDGAHKVTLTSKEFEKNPAVISFAEELDAQFNAALEKARVDPRTPLAENGLLVVLTGGGANLPMVKDLAEGHSRRPVLRRRRAPLLPEGVPSNIAPEYLQLAVAWGGAMPDLPEVGKTVQLPSPPLGPPDPRRIESAMIQDSGNWRTEPH